MFKYSVRVPLTWGNVKAYRWFDIYATDYFEKTSMSAMSYSWSWLCPVDLVFIYEIESLVLKPAY